MVLLLQLLQNIVEMVDECKSSVKSLRQQCQLTTLRSVDSQADVNQRTGLFAAVTKMVIAEHAYSWQTVIYFAAKSFFLNDHRSSNGT